MHAISETPFCGQPRLTLWSINVLYYQRLLGRTMDHSNAATALYFLFSRSRNCLCSFCQPVKIQPGSGEPIWFMVLSYVPLPIRGLHPGAPRQTGIGTLRWPSLVAYAPYGTLSRLQDIVMLLCCLLRGSCSSAPAHASLGKVLHKYNLHRPP